MANSVEGTVNVKITGDASDLISKLEELNRLEEQLGQGKQFYIDDNGNIASIQAQIDALNESLNQAGLTSNAFEQSLNNLASGNSPFDTYDAQLDSLNSTLNTTSGQINDNFNNMSTNADSMSNSVDKASDSMSTINTSTLSTSESLSLIVTGLNQGLELVEKIVDGVVEINEVAEEINNTLFEMSAVVGGELTDSIIEYTDTMQELYGLDGTTMINQLDSIVVAVSKMGLASDDAMKTIESLSGMAQDLGAITGDFNKAYQDIANAIDKGFVGRGSSLYNILSKDEITELKQLNSEIERFNYLMSKSDRTNGAFEKFLETNNGKIYLLNQSFESLKSNIALFANNLYASVAPVLTNILTMLNGVLSKFAELLGFSYESSDMTGISSSFTEAAGEIEGAADKAKGAILSFDDVITLQKDTGAGGGSIGSLFDTSNIDDGTSKAESAIDKVKNKIDDLIEHFKTGWDNAWDFGNGDKAVEDIKDAIGSIKDSLAEIFTDPKVVDALDDWSNQWAQTFGAITGAAAVTGVNIAAGLARGTAQFLSTDTENIKKKIIDLANASEQLGASIEQAAYNFADFSTVFNSDEFVNLTASFEKLGFDLTMNAAIIGNQMATAIVQGFNGIWATSGESIKEAVEATFQGIADFWTGLDVLMNGTAENIQAIFGGIIIPYAQEAGRIIGEEVVKPISEMWTVYFAPLFTELGNALTSLYTEHLAPLFESLMPWLEMCKQHNESILKGLGLVAQCIISVVGPSISGLIDSVLSLAIGLIEDIIDLLKGFVDIMVGIFTGNTDKIKAGAVTMIKAVVNAMIDVINSFLKLAVGPINGMLNLLNKASAKLGLSTNMELVTAPQITKLATGGIVSSSTIANIGEAGPEAVIPLANSNFIKDFAREVASAMNGGTGGTTNNKIMQFDASQFRGLDDSIATRLELGNYFKGCIDLANSY